MLAAWAKPTAPTLWTFDSSTDECGSGNAGELLFQTSFGGLLSAQQDAAHDRQQDEEDRDTDGELKQGLFEPTPRALNGIGARAKRTAERRPLGLQQDHGDQHDREDDGDEVERNVHRVSVSSS